MRRLAATLVILLAIGCREEPAIRVTQTTIETDSSGRTKFTFRVTMPTKGRPYSHNDFVLVDTAGHTYTPSHCYIYHSGNQPDEVEPTFECGFRVEPAALRIAEFRKELHTGGTHR